MKHDVLNWEKLGMIFNPMDFELPNNCIEFAQSPQTLVFDDFVRIYFSTREVDKNGKFLSHIAFVDMSKDLRRTLNVSSKPVIELGKLGCFDEHGIFPINVVRFKNKILAYTCGWSRRVSVSVETSIGFAESFDNGLTFIKKGNGPILSSSLNEPFLVGDAFVQIFNNKFHMWYIFGTRWINTESSSERVYKIGHAVSNDGETWIKEEGKQIVSDSLNEDECQALPTVIMHKGKYHMFFCYRFATDFRKNKNRGYKIGYAYSEDLINWKRDDHKLGLELSSEGWDSEMMCYPHAFSIDNKIFLLYNGNAFGRHGFGAAVLKD